MLSKDEIYSVFSYSYDERQTFSYIDKYMNRVMNYASSIKGSDERLRNYALAGLFLTYRACNHSGTSMSTVKNEFPTDSVHKKRLDVYASLFGDISSTSSYLDLINYSMFKMLFVPKSFFLLKLATRI